MEFKNKKAEYLKRVDWRNNIGDLWRELHEMVAEYSKFDLNLFKSSFKETWKYFSKYIKLDSVDREDIVIINYINRVLDAIMLDSGHIDDCTTYTCVLFLDGLIDTISSYDLGYLGGFYSDGIIRLTMPHCAGTSGFVEIRIEDFEKKFNAYYEYYKNDYGEKYEEY